MLSQWCTCFRSKIKRKSSTQDITWLGATTMGGNQSIERTSPHQSNNIPDDETTCHESREDNDCEEEETEPEPPKIPRKSSISLKHREEGNALYKKATVEGLAPILRKTRLEEAIPCYENALKTAKGDIEAAASAAKNCAKAYQQLSKLFQEDAPQKKEYYVKIISHFSQALSYGETCKSAEWRDDIVAAYGSVFEEAMEKYRDLPAADKISIFESFAHVVVSNDIYHADLFEEIATLLLHEAVKAVADRDFKKSMYYLKEMNRPIEELKRYGREGQAESFEMEVVYNMATTESLQEINLGDKILENNLKDDEQLNMDLVYVVIDKYRQAMVLSRNIEVEIEAIALSRLGSLYDRVLKMKYRASDCFKKCLELAMSLTPRVMTSEPWYQDATNTLQRYQQESIVEQDAKRERERQQFLDELADELQDLQEAQNKFAKADFDELLLHIYKTYPAKTKRKIPTKEDLKDLEGKQLKKVYQKAILHYHPDKQDVAAHGLKWKVLCDEITKILTNTYETLDC